MHKGRRCEGACLAMEPQRVECNGLGMERKVWNGKMRAGKTSWFLSWRVVQDMILSWGHWGDMTCF